MFPNKSMLYSVTLQRFVYEPSLGHILQRIVEHALQWIVGHTLQWIVGHTLQLIVGHTLQWIVGHTLQWFLGQSNVVYVSGLYNINYSGL